MTDERAAFGAAVTLSWCWFQRFMDKKEGLR